MICAFFDPLLRMVHRFADIPVKRKMETALSWPITGISKLPRPSLDLLEHRRNFGLESHPMYFGETMIKLPLHSLGKAYHLYEVEGWTWTESSSPGKWNGPYRNDVEDTIMAIYSSNEDIDLYHDDTNCLLYYERGRDYETFSQCEPYSPEWDRVIAAYTWDSFNPTDRLDGGVRRHPPWESKWKLSSRVPGDL